MPQTNVWGKFLLLTFEHEKEVATRLHHLNSTKGTVIPALSAINVAVNCISESGAHYLPRKRMTTKGSEQQRLRRVAMYSMWKRK